VTSTADTAPLAQTLALLGLHGLEAAELLQLLLHFTVLSMLAVGGAITTATDMHRYLVQEQGWLNDTEFNASIALAQAAPGPNILFVALLGLHSAGVAGVVLAMLGIMLPSSAVALVVGRLRRANREAVALRAFTAGLTPLTLGLLVSTGWVLTAPTRSHWGTWALLAVTVALNVRTRLSPMWLIALGAVAGMLGLVG
jgi:chromate transporter